MVESPWQARHSSLVGFGLAGLEAALATEAVNTRQRSPNCRSPAGLRKLRGSACIRHPPKISRSTAVLFLAGMGQGAVSALTGRGDGGHRGKFVKERCAGASNAFESNSMVSVPGETKGRRAGTPAAL